MTLLFTIPLSRGQVAIVDEADFAALVVNKWHCVIRGGTMYAARWDRSGDTRHLVYMHREIIGVVGQQIVDHANRHGLDNRRENLRHADKSRNAANSGMLRNNTSGFRGVHWDHVRKCWRARIWCAKCEYYLGRFRTPEDAARAYDAAAIKHFGEFASLNFAADNSCTQAMAAERVSA